MNSPIRTYRPVLVLAPGVLAGAEKVVLTGLLGLKEAGLNPLMIIIRETRSPHFAETFQKAIPTGIDSVCIDSTKAFDLRMPSRLKVVLSQETQPLILHSHGFKALIACYMIKGKIPHVHTHHGNTGHTLKVRIYEQIAMMTMKTCNHIIAVSHKMKEELDLKIAPYQKISVVENMLSLSNAAKIRAERKIKKANDKIRLLFVGRLSPEKGLHPFLESFAASPLKEKFHLSVLGDGIERPAITKFIADHKMENLVTMHGFVTDPSNHFIEPDLLIMPSHREGLPMTLIESLASGVPVLANNVGAIASMVSHNYNGYFSENFSKEAWMRALDVTHENYQEWLTNAAAEAESVEERFSLKQWTDKTVDLYDHQFLKH